MCVVALEGKQFTVSKAEESLIMDRRAKNAGERIKLAIRLSYRLTGDDHQPDFTGSDWVKAKEAINKRHQLMHPKSVDDLQFSDTEWQRIYEGIDWLQKTEFRFIEAMDRIRMKKVGQKQGGQKSKGTIGGNL